MSWLDRYRPLDRYWPLGLIGAVAVVLVYLISPLRSVLALPGLEHGWSAALLGHVGIAWPILWAIGLAMSSLDARDRVRGRAAALTNNVAAVPRSLIVPNPARAPDISTEPLTLLWRKAPSFLANPPFGVIATEEGLIWRRPDKPDQLMRWQEARLLEVTSRESKPTRLFTLYGEHAHAEWEGYPSQPQSAVPHRVSYDEMVARQRLLLDLIAARTGLTPRTFEPALRSEDEPVTRAEMRRAVFAYVISLVLVGLSLALAADVVLLPLTRFPSVNIYVAATLALAGLAVLVAATWSIVRQWPGRHRAGRYTLPPAPSWVTPDAVLAMSTKATWILRLGLLSVGLLLSLNGAPLVLALVDSSSIPHMEPASVILFILFWVFLAGVLGLLGGFISPTTVVVADSRGVSTRVGKQAETILWEAVECVVAHVSSGQARSFDVVGHGGAFTITWETRNVRAAEPPTGAQPVTPEEMAALVIARSGAPLRVRTAG